MIFPILILLFLFSDTYSSILVSSKILFYINAIILWVGLIVFYFIPIIIGLQKVHAKSILIINLLLGWTLLGWIGALIWAINSPEKNAPMQDPIIQPQQESLSKKEKANSESSNNILINDINKLVNLKEKGVLSEDEFQLAKKRLFTE
ncbi:superinfection immunity protein [Lentimicrobium sp. L6]|nr:superinfection immunity protein [Lentimicrobium sp. L6]